MQPVRRKGKLQALQVESANHYQALHACPKTVRDDRDGGVCVRFAARRFIEVPMGCVFFFARVFCRIDSLWNNEKL